MISVYVLYHVGRVFFGKITEPKTGEDREGDDYKYFTPEPPAQPAPEAMPDRLLERWTDSWQSGQLEDQNEICPVCGHPVEETTHICPTCGARHHPECWKLMDGCGRCNK